jgi:hypothetical protein
MKYISSKRLSSIIKESVDKLIAESLYVEHSDFTPTYEQELSELTNILTYTLDWEEPSQIAEEFQSILQEVIDTENGVAYDDQFAEYSVEQLRPYIDIIRYTAKEALEFKFNKMKEEFEKTNQTLNNCTQQIINHIQKR